MKLFSVKSLKISALIIIRHKILFFYILGFYYLWLIGYLFQSKFNGKTTAVFEQFKFLIDVATSDILEFITSLLHDLEYLL